MKILEGKNILIGITGGIAAYKCCELIRLFQKAGAQVRAIMTPNAQNFITPLTIASLCQNEVLTDMFVQDNTHIDHIRLAKWADLMVIAPASANTIAKCAHGIADNLLTTCFLACKCSVVFAPAMNVQMYRHLATQNNLKLLSQWGFNIVGPAEGYQACGDVGPGRMCEPEEIFRYCAELILKPSQSKKMVITAGPTAEPIDPVRCITNHSSGKMGYALAQAAAIQGWQVTLISGKVALPKPIGVDIVSVSTAAQMLEESWKAAKCSNCFIGCAAVADFKPQSIAPQKIKKSADDDTLKLILTKNPDIIKTIAGLDHIFTVGFAAETNDLIAYARHKLESKNLDMIIANDVSAEGIGFNSDNNKVSVIYRDLRQEDLPLMSKEDLAIKIIQAIDREMAKAG